MFELVELNMEEIGCIEPMWEQLIAANAGNSPYFSALYGTFEFSVRCGFLREKEAAGCTVYTAVLRDADSGEDAGFVTVTYHSEASTGEVEMLFVKEAYRGQGLGRRLFQIGLDCLDRNAISDRKLCVTYGNEAALRLYASFGFYPFTIDCLYKAPEAR